MALHYDVLYIFKWKPAAANDVTKRDDQQIGVGLTIAKKQYIINYKIMPNG